jgi:hypothetical protein
MMPGIAGALAGLGGDVGLTVTPVTVGLDNDVTVGTVYGYTATGLTVGAPVFVAICGNRDGGFSTRDISSVTIGGVAATLISKGAASAVTGGVYFLPSAPNSSQAISVTFSANMQAVVLGHFQITGTTQTTYSARTGATAASTTSGSGHTSTPGIAIPSGGVGIAFVYGNSTAAINWSDDAGSAGAEMLDVQVSTGLAEGRLSLYTTPAAGATTYTAAPAGGASGTRKIAAFTWGP